MSVGDESKHNADTAPTPRRKPWIAPVLTEIEVATLTYGPSNASTDDPSFTNTPS